MYFEFCTWIGEKRCFFVCGEFKVFLKANLGHVMDKEKRGSSNSTSFASTVLAFQFIAKSKRSVAQRWGFETELQKRWWWILALQNLSKNNFSSTELVPSGVEIFGMQFLRKNRFILAIIDLCWKDYCDYLHRTKNWTPFCEGWHLE